MQGESTLAAVVAHTREGRHPVSVRSERSAQEAARANELTISPSFGFDAAYPFTGMPRGHCYHEVHGHSVTMEVSVRGQPQAPNGFVADFCAPESACKGPHKALDYTLLNEVPGLAQPSPGNICVWIWGKLRPKFPGLKQVTLRRDSLGQACTSQS